MHYAAFISVLRGFARFLLKVTASGFVGTMRAEA
jgi:hypothetical protein